MSLAVLVGSFVLLLGSGVEGWRANRIGRRSYKLGKQSVEAMQQHAEPEIVTAMIVKSNFDFQRAMRGFRDARVLALASIVGATVAFVISLV